MRWAAVSTVIRTRVGTGAGVSTTASRANGAAGWFVAGVSLVALDAGAVGTGAAPSWLEGGISLAASPADLGGRAVSPRAEGVTGWFNAGASLATLDAGAAW